MQRIYLDQNRWIELSRAKHRTNGGADFEDALAVAETAVERGDASFVLAEARYIETSRRSNRQSRERLGKTMAALSRFHAIAPQTVLLPWEIDRGLAALTGSPEPPMPKLFGIGVSHCFGADVAPIELAKDLDLPPGIRSQVEGSINEYIEHSMLYGEHSHMPSEWLEKLHQNTIGEQYANFESDLADRIKSEKFGTRGRLERVVLATEVNDIKKPLALGLSRAGVSIDDFFGMGRESIQEFLLGMPTRRVAYEMRLARHRNPQKAWTSTDLNDVGALCVAVPYCDSVFTEKSWVHILEQARLGAEFGTRIKSRTADLVPTLIEATLER